MIVSLPAKLALAAALLFAGARLPAVEIVAHRGASHDAPENTVAAAKLAWEQKSDAVEFDIHLTKDGKIAVLHDKNTKRTAGCDADIVTLTLAEARQLDAGSWKGPQFAGEKIPTIEEIIATLPRGKRLFIEIKTGPELVPELAAVLKRTGITEKQATIISFNFDTLKAVRQQMPKFETQWLLSYRSPEAAKIKKGAPSPPIDQVIREAKAAGLTGLDLNHAWPVDAAAAKRIRDAGLQLHVWTVDEPAIARRWISVGVQSITTNRPGWLREQLK